MEIVSITPSVEHKGKIAVMVMIDNEMKVLLHTLSQAETNMLLRELQEKK